MKKQAIPSGKIHKGGPVPLGAQPMIPVEHAARMVQANVAVVMRKLGVAELTLSRDDFTDMESRYSVSQTPGIAPHSVVFKLVELPKAEPFAPAPSNLAIPGRDF